MENQNQPINPQPVQPVPEAPVMAKPDLKTKIKTWFNSQSQTTKKLVFVAIILFSLIFVLLILTMLFAKRPSKVASLPTPTPISSTPAPEVILNASRYATDSGVLKIEADLKDIEKRIDTSDVKQSDLNLPNLDYNINFTQ